MERSALASNPANRASGQKNYYRMKKLLFIFPAWISLMAISCGDGAVKREQNKVYMPDMAYSRAYETYADHSNLTDSNIFYNNMPVTGTVSRSENYVYHVEKDLTGDTVNYAASHTVQNPVTSLTKEAYTETERLYLINCAICHGSKLDGNGPLWKDGSGPFPAKPATLVGDAKYVAMSEGTMYYSVTYGRNLMGSYASQLTPQQRWEIIYYIKNKQGVKGGSTAVPATDSATTAAK
ncbi:cytochrome c [soil metagenome]